MSYACIGERIINNMIGNKTVYINIKTLNTKRLPYFRNKLRADEIIGFAQSI